MATQYQDLGKKVNQMLRLAYKEFQDGYSKYNVQLSIPQQENILKEDFYNVLKQVPKEYLPVPAFREAAQETTGLDQINKLNFLTIFSATYRRLGLAR